ncbi:hypothetical protein ACGE24_07380 [Corynebacterium kroppenstedtii]|uniref:hypothetical protein n=1 Tax=Corynebacterium sp. PCR 32 TaxID=3351342 RepID=UPI0030997258
MKSVEDSQPRDVTVDERVKERAEKGRKFQFTTLRGTEEQKAIIDFAVKKEKTSIQAIFMDIVMRRIEETYGEEFDREVMGRL